MIESPAVAEKRRTPARVDRARVNRDGLEQVLSALELRLGVMRRTAVPASGIVALPQSSVSLVYVVDGIVRGIPALSETCTLDVDRASSTIMPSLRTDRAQLVAGDAFLSLGRHSFALEATTDATIVVGELTLSENAAHISAVLPEAIVVTSFADLEPAAAALAASMGQSDPTRCALRSGDPVICRMMVTTVLLSVIRAWAENGCAPEGWPSLAGDPFLDRVVAAIRDEPGRDWTVDLLATVGAMSRSVFAERFRSALGRSPASYVTEVRMDSAKRMLDAGASVSAVSRELGYGSDEGFSRAFRRHTGMTPSTWRAQRMTATRSL